MWRRFILLFFGGGAEAQRTAICMAKASDFIQHGEGIFGLNYSGEQEFGAIISSVSYSWSAKGDVELIGDIVDVHADVLNLCIKNSGEEIPAKVTKAICKSVDVKMETQNYRSFTVKATYGPNIVALNPDIASE